MSDVVSCDSDRHDVPKVASPEEAELEWLVVGFKAAERYDACSPACAARILNDQIASALKRMAVVVS